jgi:hypothetical protein
MKLNKLGTGIAIFGAWWMSESIKESTYMYNSRSFPEDNSFAFYLAGAVLGATTTAIGIGLILKDCYTKTHNQIIEI